MTPVILGTIILLVVAGAVFTFNRIMRTRNQLDILWGGIDVLLLKRRDLLPPLLEAVKGYTGNEAELFSKIARAGSEGLEGEEPISVTQEENRITNQIKTLLSIANTYPELKKDHTFLDLWHRLDKSEEEIDTARKRYNDAVRDYNNLIHSFPSSLFAQAMDIQKEQFFEMQFVTVRKS